MGRKNKVKDMHTRKLIIDMRRQIKESIEKLDFVSAKIPNYIKLGQDLFLTSNIWLIDDDTKTNPAKCIESLETLLIIRHYLEVILTQWMTLRNLRVTFKDLLVKLKNGQLSPEEIMGTWVEKITAITSLGEVVSEALISLVPIKEKYEAQFNNNNLEGLYKIFSAMLTEAQAYNENMKELNLNNLTQEEQTAADKIVQDALNGELSEEDAAKVMNGVDILNDALLDRNDCIAASESDNEEPNEIGEPETAPVETPNEKESEPTGEENSDSYQ